MSDGELLDVEDDFPNYDVDSCAARVARGTHQEFVTLSHLGQRRCVCF